MLARTHLWRLPKLVPLLRELVKVNFKTLRQIDQGFLAHDRGEVLLAVSATG
ncbi:hypothetical protein N9F34_02315 [Alphaproteobacteria bacterium]|nr:hypothetical protein [Alphaproteobacteria bacterium]